MLSTNNISGGGGASLSDATPAPLGVAAPGTDSGASHSDHVHAAPLSTDITDSSAVGQAVLTAANAPNARTALGLGTASVLNVGNTSADVALRGYVETFAGALADTSLTMLAPVATAIGFPDLSTGMLAPLTYDNGTKTLTAGVNMDISGVLLPVGTSLLIYFTGSDLHASGIYTVTNSGANDPGGAPPVFARRSDLDASGDFSSGLAVLSQEEGKLFRLTVPGGFIMGDLTVAGHVVFTHIGSAAITEGGLIQVLATGLVGNPDAGTVMIASGSGTLQRSSSDISAFLVSASAAAARTALAIPSNSFGTGTLAARPVSPVAGDTYAVTTGFARGDRYRCYVATVWEPLTEYYDFSGATGWTAQANAGAASITSGIARLSTAVDPSVRTDAGGWTYNAPALTRALPAWVSSLDVMVRISSMSLAAVSFAHLEISDAISGGNRRSVIVNQAGAPIFYNNTANSSIVAWGSVFGSYTGQEWLRLVQADGVLTAYTGVGVGGQLPKSWTSRGSESIATAWTHVALSMQSYSGVGTRTIEFDDLLIRWGD